MILSRLGRHITIIDEESHISRDPALRMYLFTKCLKQKKSQKLLYNVQPWFIISCMTNWHTISSLVAKCHEEGDLDKQVQILRKINSMLPPQFRLSMPSLITDDYIRKALDIIQEIILENGPRRPDRRQLNHPMFL